MTNEKLLPCPFCGGEGEYVADCLGCAGETHAVFCKNCYAWIYTFTKEEAIKAWNRRAK